MIELKRPDWIEGKERKYVDYDFPVVVDLPVGRWRLRDKALEKYPNVDSVATCVMFCGAAGLDENGYYFECINRSLWTIRDEYSQEEAMEMLRQRNAEAIRIGNVKVDLIELYGL